MKLDYSFSQLLRIALFQLTEIFKRASNHLEREESYEMWPDNISVTNSGFFVRL